MALNYIETYEQAAVERLHAVRDEYGTVVGVNVTLSPDELGAIMRQLNGTGSLDGGWTILEAARQELNSYGWSVSRFEDGSL